LFVSHVDPRYQAYFLTAFLTGMRCNELLALKWSNVDLVLRSITVREAAYKGRKVRRKRFPHTGTSK